MKKQEEKAEKISVSYHIPKNAMDFEGQFIVFFSSNPDASVLFHSFDSEECQGFAEKTFAETGNRPTIFRVSKTDSQASRLFLSSRA